VRSQAEIDRSVEPGLVSEETKLALLLTAVLGSSTERSVKPLSLFEYNKIDRWLQSEEVSLEDLLLLSREDIDRIPAIGEQDDKRVFQLLKRGASLALSLDRWMSIGIWIIGRKDPAYPEKLITRLDEKAPPIIFGSGVQDLFNHGGLAIVGSRNVVEEGLYFANRIGVQCAKQGVQVISGGAKGVDRESMEAALDESGNVIGVLSNGLSQATRSARYRERIRDGNLALISVVNPDAGFSVGNAMGRNKYIYALSDWALVVSATLSKGGTWAGAIENVRNGWAPLFVWQDQIDLPGNRVLIDKGAVPIKTKEVINHEVHLTQFFQSRLVGFDEENVQQLPLI